MTACYNLGVLLADHIPENLRWTVGGDYDTLYQSFFSDDSIAPPGYSVRVRTYWTVDGSFPADDGDCDGWLISSSRHSVNEGLPWIEGLKEFVRKTSKRTVGICFGHQLINSAFGGKVSSACGWVVGPQILRLVNTPWSSVSELTLPGVHRETVVLLPHRAVALGSCPGSRYAVVERDDQFLSMQYHPEFSAAYAAGLISSRRNMIGPSIADQAMRDLMSAKLDSGEGGRILLRFLASAQRQESGFFYGVRCGA